MLSWIFENAGGIIDFYDTQEEAEAVAQLLMGSGSKEVEVIDFTKPLRARVFDADEAYYGTCEMEVEVQAIALPRLPYTTTPEILYNGGSSHAFDLVPQD